MASRTYSKEALLSITTVIIPCQIEVASEDAILSKICHLFIPPVNITKHKLLKTLYLTLHIEG